MVSSERDIRTDLQGRMDILQKEISELESEKASIEARVLDARIKLDALRRVYEIESERFGEPSLPLFRRGDKSYRFAGMKVGEALKILKKENPRITKDQAYNILVKESFDFGDKRPKSSVHFAWIALERSKKWRQK